MSSDRKLSWRGTDVFQLWISQTVGLGLNASNAVTMACAHRSLSLRTRYSLTCLCCLADGIIMIFSGRTVAPRLIAALGPRTFTTIALLSQAAAFAVWGTAPTVAAVAIGLCLLVPGINAGSKSALQGAATDHAVAAGFGRGEFSGDFNNLRATSVFLCPLIYGRLYAWLMERGVMPGRTWWLLMVVASLVPELLHRSIRDADYAAPKHA